MESLTTNPKAKELGGVEVDVKSQTAELIRLFKSKEWDPTASDAPQPDFTLWSTFCQLNNNARLVQYVGDKEQGLKPLRRGNVYAPWIGSAAKTSGESLIFEDEVGSILLARLGELRDDRTETLANILIFAGILRKWGKMILDRFVNADSSTDDARLPLEPGKLLLAVIFLEATGGGGKVIDDFVSSAKEKLKKINAANSVGELAESAVKESALGLLNGKTFVSQINKDQPDKALGVLKKTVESRLELFENAVTAANQGWSEAVQA